MAENNDKFSCNIGYTYAAGIDDTIASLNMQMNETMDEFIFTSLSPFIHQLTTIEIPKQELAEAIRLIRMKKEANEKYGCSLSNDWSTATRQCEDLRNAYNRGREDGIKYANKKLIKFLDGIKEELGDLDGEKED